MSEFLIERLGHLGDGIAEGPIYAPGALPGERVAGTLEGNVLREVKIMAPSETRVKARCRHYKSCGGCQLQHADDAFLAQWKTGIVREALAAQGIETEMREIAVSPANARRRAGFSARRTKKGATAGFHAKGSDLIVELSECHVVVPELLEGARVAQDLARIGTSRKGELRVTVTLSEAGPDVRVEGGKPLDGPLRIALAHLADGEGRGVIDEKRRFLKLAAGLDERWQVAFVQLTAADFVGWDVGHISQDTTGQLIG